MARTAVTHQEAVRLERLLRSLVGVADLHLVSGDDASLRRVHILRERRVQHHQLVRNITSAMQAGFGVRVGTEAITVHDDALAFDHARAVFVPAATERRSELAGGALAIPEVVDAAAAGAPPAGPVAHANGNDAGDAAPADPRVSLGRKAVRGVAAHDAAAQLVAPVDADAREVRHGASPAREDSSPRVGDLASAGAADQGLIVQLEQIDVERNASMMRCRVVLDGMGMKYTAIAEMPFAALAEAELAARVTLDALRAGTLTPALLDGIGFVTIAETKYVVASVRDSNDALPRSGTAQLGDSMAWAAALAVIDAVGTLTPAAEILRPLGLVPQFSNETR